MMYFFTFVWARILLNLFTSIYIRWNLLRFLVVSATGYFISDSLTCKSFTSYNWRELTTYTSLPDWRLIPNGGGWGLGSAVGFSNQSQLHPRLADKSGLQVHDWFIDEIFYIKYSVQNAFLIIRTRVNISSKIFWYSELSPKTPCPSDPVDMETLTGETIY